MTLCRCLHFTLQCEALQHHPKCKVDSIFIPADEPSNIFHQKAYFIKAL